MSPLGRPKGEYRSARHGGFPVSRRAAPQAHGTAARSAEVTQ